MTRKEMTALLAALKITGWPEWTHGTQRRQLFRAPRNWCVQYWHTLHKEWMHERSCWEHEALALCEHHLLEWLRQLGGVEVRAMEHGHVAVWTNPMLANPKAICVSADADTLLAALVAAVLAVRKEKKT